MRITNTLTKEKENFVPLNDKKVKMFVCGPTVYDYSHIGHAKTNIAFDMVVRYLRYKGYDVHYLMNITDVDDKIINRANENNRDPMEVAREFEKYFMEDMKTLHVLDNIDDFQRASDNIDAIIDQIERLIDKGYAYVVSDGVYFDVTKFEEYGKLSHQSLDDLNEHRIEPNPEKRNPQDFALWKVKKPDEKIYWDSPWGEGRPGWHIEDTAITEKYLGEQYDIHGGALDLIFPHHDCEIAQMESLSKKPLVKYWMHGGFLTVNGEKMSKSLGNFITIRDILKKISPEALRLFLLRTHYRSPIDFSDKALQDAKESHERLNNTYNRLYILKEESPKGPDNKKIDELVEKAYTDFETSMDDDFSSSEAFAVIFNFTREVNKILDSGKFSSEDLENILDFYEDINFVFSILVRSEEEVPIEVIDLIEKRENFRKQKNFKEADRIRDEIVSMGYEVEDTPHGPLPRKNK